MPFAFDSGLITTKSEEHKNSKLPFHLCIYSHSILFLIPTANFKFLFIVTVNFKFKTFFQASKKFEKLKNWSDLKPSSNRWGKVTWSNFTSSKTIKLIDWLSLMFSMKWISMNRSTFDEVIKFDHRRSDHTFDEVIKFDFRRSVIRRSDPSLE